MKNILITGGAGYIGSHVAEILVKKKKKIFIVDNLCTGFTKLLNKKAHFINLNILSTTKLKKIIIENKIDSVIHLAASLSIAVGEKHPKFYYKNNVLGTKSLLKACRNSVVKNFIFSSTAAVYKEGQKIVSEKSKLGPKSVYGKTKLFAEKQIIHSCKKMKITYGILRYFNVCGASSSGKIGIISRGDHLFKNLSAEALKKKPLIKIYGSNYNTPDGTAIRDFIHVSDLAEVHYQVLRIISKTKKSKVLNCGYNRGLSVKQVVEEFKNQIKQPIKVNYQNRRPGDMEVLISNNKYLKELINWKPKHDNLRRIVKSCIRWEKRINS
ncbi:UDP-glucose 4-epimerase GalE [Pelagibacteraceae bacterium]|nr:UDP-glucose 4-epimerase GalE [Pelagibacteraceae bacterium]